MKEWHIEAGGPHQGIFVGQKQDVYYINDSDGDTVVMCKTKEAAESIVRDHNAGPELLAACERVEGITGCWSYPLENCGDCQDAPDCKEVDVLAWRQLIAVIAKAKGDQ